VEKENNSQIPYLAHTEALSFL